MAVQLAKLQREEDPRQGPLYRPTPQPMAPQEKSAAQQMTDMAANRAMTKGLDYGEKKITEGVSSMLAPSVAAPSATQMTSMTNMAGQGLSPGAAQAIMGSGSSAAPLVAEASGMAGAELAKMGGAELAKQATANAVTSGAATGGMGAAMGALGTAVPYIGAAMLAGKAFGLFNKGGHVGPLYAAEGKIAYPSYKSSYSDLTDDEILKLSPREQEEYIKTIGIEEAMDAMYNSKGGAVHANMGGLMPMLMDKAKEEGIPMGLASMLNKGGMAGPLAKVEYKSKGGETYKLSYGGPISKGV
jgi:hypothetical protein